MSIAFFLFVKKGLRVSWVHCASLSRVVVARGLCRRLSHPMPQLSEALAFRRRVLDLSTHRATFIRCHMHALPQSEEDADAPAILCRTPVAASSSWLRVPRCYMNRMFTLTAYWSFSLERGDWDATWFRTD